MLRKILGTLVHTTNTSENPAAQRLMERPGVRALQEQARAHGFEPLGILSERPLFGGAHIFVEVWGNPTIPAYVDLVPDLGEQTPQARYHFNTSFTDGRAVLSWGKPEVRTRGGETIEVYSGSGHFGTDLRDHAARVARNVREGRIPDPKLNLEHRVAGVQRFYATHASVGDLLPIGIGVLLYLAFLVAMPCWLAFAGSAPGAYAALGGVAALPLMGRGMQRLGSFFGRAPAAEAQAATRAPARAA